jgi:LPS-assembly lipoprotein
MKRVAPFTLAMAALMLSGCGLRPVYSDGSHGAVAQMAGNVEVAAIEGKSGWLVRNALNDRLAALATGTGPKYRLVVKLDDSIQGFGVRSDDTITRERRTLRARYQLVDDSTGTQVIDDTAGSDVGIDVVSSEYATIAAEDTAMERLAQTIADQIMSRLALYALKEGKPAAPAAR